MRELSRRVPALALAAMLSACGLDLWFLRGTALEAVEAGRAQVCGAQDAGARVRLFDAPASVVAWQQQSGVDLNIDGMLEPGRYALIEMGQHNSGGYGLAVSREARLAGTTLRVYATFFAPAPGAMTAQMLTSPCVLVRLPQTEFGVVEVYDQDGELRASTGRKD